MSDDTKAQSQTSSLAAGGQGNDDHGNGAGHDKPGRFKFSVDGRPFESETPVLTGAQIKAQAEIDPSFLLYLEARGGASDRQIADTASVDLRELPGREEFYTSPPATFGATFPAAAVGRCGASAR